MTRAWLTFVLVALCAVSLWWGLTRGQAPAPTGPRTWATAADRPASAPGSIDGGVRPLRPAREDPSEAERVVLPAVDVVPVARVKGRVVDRDGKAIEGSKVALFSTHIDAHGARERREPVVGWTDANGAFDLQQAVDGELRSALYVYASGHQLFNISLRALEPGDVLALAHITLSGRGPGPALGLPGGAGVPGELVRVLLQAQANAKAIERTRALKRARALRQESVR
ncbi:MAG: hypothetical protein AAF628_29085 [Planctomycetota bacterium]